MNRMFAQPVPQLQSQSPNSSLLFSILLPHLVVLSWADMEQYPSKHRLQGRRHRLSPPDLVIWDAADERSTAEADRAEEEGTHYNYTALHLSLCISYHPHQGSPDLAWSVYIMSESAIHIGRR